MQPKNINLGLLSRNPRPVADANPPPIEILRQSGSATELPAADKDRRQDRPQTNELLAKAIGLHRIRAIPVRGDSASAGIDSRFTTNLLSTGNFQMVDVRWDAAFELEQDPLEVGYIIYLVLAGSLTQKLNFPQQQQSTEDECSPVPNPGETRQQRLCPTQTLDCSPATATIVSPGQQLTSIASAAGAALLIAIDRDSIDLALGKLLDRTLKQPVVFLSDIDLTRDLGLNLQQFVQFLWDAAATSNLADRSSLVVRELEKAFLGCLVAGLPSNYSADLLHQHDRAFACHVRTAQAFIESHLHEDLKLEEIATAAGVCSRLLQKAFAQECGCSPMRFVTQARLEGVRRELERRSIADTKIMDVMMDYGFTQGGKFAKEYQQLFGEKPSDTLKRSSQCHQADAPLWTEIDDARSDLIVGGCHAITSVGYANGSSQMVFTPERLPSKLVKILFPSVCFNN